MAASLRQNLAYACGAALVNSWQAWRGTRVLALGDSFGSRREPGKSAQVVERLQKLNPALRVESLCGPGLGLLDAGVAAGTYARRSFDAALVFLGPAQIASLDDHDNFAEQADGALQAIAAVARRPFLVTAFDAGTRAGRVPDRAAAGRVRWLERTLRHLCELHGVEWVRLSAEEGSIAAAPEVSDNFSVDGFRPATDRHEMWTARMLQQPALAQLVFH
ncbi:MAG: hypothetical protein V4505_17865 [Pseudomonadota bacterium]